MVTVLEAAHASRERREEVSQYVYRKYGRGRAAPRSPRRGARAPGGGAGPPPPGGPIAISGGTAALVPSALAPGTRDIDAEFTGSQNFAPSTGELTQTVALVPSTTTLDATAIACPVIASAPGAHSQSTVAATSSGRTRRAWGFFFTSSASASSALRPVFSTMVAIARRAMSVSV